jgi:N-acetylated-alpha-linked acidic dipeptidase
VTRDIKDPKTGKSVYQQWQDRFHETRPEMELTEAAAGTDTRIVEARIGALGSGSDYTPFLQHLGVPSADMSFGGDYGVYHSAYDSFHWMSRFGDPSFEYHVAAAQLWGTLAMRIANGESVPLDYVSYASQIREFFIESMRTARSRNLASGINERLMNTAIDEFAIEAARLEKRREELLQESSKNDESTARKLARLNEALIAVERAFIDERGLRGRSWYRHQIYAPGYYTGYAAQPLPDFRQALEDRNALAAGEALDRIVAALHRAAAVLRKGRD